MNFSLYPDLGFITKLSNNGFYGCVTRRTHSLTFKCIKCQRICQAYVDCNLGYVDLYKNTMSPRLRVNNNNFKEELKRPILLFNISKIQK